MAYTSEIDKLERRWKENPQGTVFAPLAEVYRKDGQLERAREVLQQGLVNNPDHIPGNIVLGRCCLDLGDDGGAEAAFSHVLELDPENVIALKALGEITERQGRLAEASQWLGRLMQVDPTNDDAREQLKRLEAVQQQAALVMSAEPIAEVSPPEEPEFQDAPLDEPVPEAIEPAWAETRSQPRHSRTTTLWSWRPSPLRLSILPPSTRLPSPILRRLWGRAMRASPSRRVTFFPRRSSGPRRRN